MGEGDGPAVAGSQAGEKMMMKTRKKGERSFGLGLIASCEGREVGC